MIERETLMSARENVHQLVDTLPEEQLDDVLDYLAELQDGDEPLSAESQAAIEEGLDDIRNGRTVPLEEYRRTRGL
jgi:predicted transcriptional regulator